MWAIVIIVTLGRAVMWREPWAKLAAVLGLTSLGLQGFARAPWKLTSVDLRALSCHDALSRTLRCLGFTGISHIVLVALRRSAMGLGGVVLMRESWSLDLVGAFAMAMVGPARSIPEFRVTLPQATRYALVPAFQPLVFGGKARA